MDDEFYSNFIWIYGSGALSCKTLLIRIIENHKIILDQVRLNKGWLCPAGLGKRLRQGPVKARNRKKTPP